MSEGYDLSVFKLPQGKGQPAAQSRNSTSSAPDSSPGGYDLSVFDLPEQIVIPQRTKDGKVASEKIHIRDFGKHVRAQVENAMTYGSPEEGVKALYWAIGTAQGASLMPAPALKQFSELGLGFAASKNPKVFFSKSVIPFLNSLTPGKRGKA
jgi:hypothetical protein